MHRKLLKLITQYKGRIDNYSDRPDTIKIDIHSTETSNPREYYIPNRYSMEQGPLITIDASVGNYQTTGYEFIDSTFMIDTGAQAAVVITDEIVNKLKLKPISTQSENIIIGDGNTVDSNEYIIELQLGSMKFITSALHIKGSSCPIIGMGLLYKFFKFTINNNQSSLVANNEELKKIIVEL